MNEHDTLLFVNVADAIRTEIGRLAQLTKLDLCENDLTGACPENSPVCVLKTRLLAVGVYH